MKTNKRKFIALALCSAFLICASVLGATAAWFTDSAKATGTITTGNLSLTASINGSAYTDNSSTLSTSITKTNVMPGDEVLGAVKFKVATTDPTGAYVRVKLTLPAGVGTVTPDISSTDWKLESDGYYYYGSSSAKANLKTAAKNTEITFCTKAVLATSTTNTAAGKTGVTISVVIEATQIANQGSTVVWA